MIILDRFEEHLAILEIAGSFIKVHASKVSPDAKEGDVLIFNKGKYIADKNLTDKRKKMLNEEYSWIWE